MSTGVTSVAPDGPSTIKRLELADIFARFGASFVRQHNLPKRHRKVMQQIVNCRTEVLGGQRRWCARCGYQRFLFHSCRNRHCPKCQTSAKERWREARATELLPVPYFHNVFTLPHELNAFFLKNEDNQRLLLNLLFEATAKTLLEFGQQTFGGQIGFTTVLHTWDQRLKPHFHLHVLIPAGALKTDSGSSQWVAGGKQFLFPVRGLSVMFRAKFLTGFKQLLSASELSLPAAFEAVGSTRQLVNRLFKKSWVVYSKRPFAGPAKLLDYLSRYTHRVALTNNRLIDCHQGQVRLTFRDRRDGDQRKVMTLPAEKLIGRFLQHVLPSRLMRIRHYGFLANRFKRVRLAMIRKLIGATAPASEPENNWLKDWIESIVGESEGQCPCCGQALEREEIRSQLVRRVDVGLPRVALPIRGSPA